MVVHGQDLLVEAAAVEVLDPLEQVVHCRPGLGGVEVELADAVAAAGVGKVVHAEPRDVLRLQEVQHPGELVGVLAVQGEAHSHLDALVAAAADPGQRLVEGPSAAAHLVVHLAQAVQADADVDEARVADALRHRL